MPSINKFHKHSSNVPLKKVSQTSVKEVFQVWPKKCPKIMIQILFHPLFSTLILNFKISSPITNNQNQRMKLKQGMGQDVELGGLYR
jgi:hypothetical protein